MYTVYGEFILEIKKFWYGKPCCDIFEITLIFFVNFECTNNQK